MVLLSSQRARPRKRAPWGHWPRGVGAVPGAEMRGKESGRGSIAWRLEGQAPFHTGRSIPRMACRLPPWSPARMKGISHSTGSSSERRADALPDANTRAPRRRTGRRAARAPARGLSADDAFWTESKPPIDGQVSANLVPWANYPGQLRDTLGTTFAFKRNRLPGSYLSNSTRGSSFMCVLKAALRPRAACPHAASWSAICTSICPRR